MGDLELKEAGLWISEKDLAMPAPTNEFAKLAQELENLRNMVKIMQDLEAKNEINAPESDGIKLKLSKFE